MVRSRKRTTEKAKWKEQEQEAAKRAVREGRSVKSVAQQFNITRTTLRDRLKSGKARLGRKPLLNAALEKELADHVLLLAKIFFGMTKTELRRLAFEIAERSGIQNNFNKNERLAAMDWLNGFQKRNPEISLRKPEPTSMYRITAFNKEKVHIFYTNVENVVDKYKSESSRIYNMDETGISTVQKSGKILGPTGQKQVGSATSWERGKNVTVCCAMSASGIYIPFMFIYPRRRMSHLMEKGVPEGAIYNCSKSGWINEELFIV
jgi:transposase-like protein